MSDLTSQRGHRASKRARLNPTIPHIFQFSFLKSLLLPLLHDGDVLTRLIITHRSVKQWIGKYPIKRLLPYKRAIELAHDIQMSHVTIQHICIATSSNLTEFPNLLSVSFAQNFNQPLPVGSLPNHINKLDLGSTFNQPIHVEALPSSITSLKLSHEFDHPLVPGAIPSKVEHLSLGLFNQPLALGSLPSALLSVDFHRYNHPLDPGVIPVRVRSISFPSGFNHPLVPGIFPASVTSMEFFGSKLRYPIHPGVLPCNLQSLSISEGYNEPFLPGCFPDSLTDLFLGRGYKQLIPDGVLPPNLIDLTIECHINQTFSPGFFLNKLTRLRFKRLHTDILPGVLPSSLTHLLLGSHFHHPLQLGSLPPSLLHLELGPEFNHTLVAGVLPPNLVKLSFGEKFTHPLPKGIIPSSVQHVNITTAMSLAWLSPTVTHLTINIVHMNSSEQIFPGMILDQITHLTLIGYVNFEFPLVPGFVPASVTHLSLLLDEDLHGQDIEDLDGLIPMNVQHLRLTCHPVQPIPKHIQANIIIGFAHDIDGPPIFYEPEDPRTFIFPIS